MRDVERKAKPTEADREAARRLRAIYTGIAREKRPTQEKLAEEWAKHWGNMTQGGISQYLNGQLPINVQTVLRFAMLLKCSPADIRSDMPEIAYFSRARIVPLHGWPFKGVTYRDYEDLDDKQKRHLERIVTLHVRASKEENVTPV